MEGVYELRYEDEFCSCGGVIDCLYPIEISPRIWRGECIECGKLYDVYYGWSDNE